MMTKNDEEALTAERVMMVCSGLARGRAFMAMTVPVAVVSPGIRETKMPARLPVATERPEAFRSMRLRVSGSRF